MLKYFKLKKKTISINFFRHAFRIRKPIIVPKNSIQTCPSISFLKFGKKKTKGYLMRNKLKNGRR